MPNMEDTKKFQQLLAKAQSGDAGAMSTVADAYFYGDGVEKNPQQCFAWIEKAAAHLPKAMFNLALAYKNGWGVEKDMSQYFAWTEKAAEAGFPDAMFALALAYEDGLGVEKNPQQCFAWTKKAADAGLPKAMFNLALAYEDGSGVEKDMSQFFAWTKKAADAGSPKAMHNLAIAYEDGLGVEKNPQQCFAWTKKAADAGFPDAMFNLALDYKNGSGVEKDMSQFFAWTKKAVKADFPKAMLNLAIAYKDGLGVKKNPERFFHWVEVAYRKGDINAAIMFPFSRLWQNEEIDEPTYDEIEGALVDLRDECKSILQEKHNEEGQSLSHYTKFVALDSILKEGESNHLRLYNVAYFNDPLEGAAFPAALVDGMCEWIYGRKGEIPHEIAVEGKKFSVYACAFSARDDHLPLWIAYGNNGDGYNITGTIPQHMKADEESGAMQDMHRSFSLAKDETATEKTKDALIRVYKVQYGKEAEDTAQRLALRLENLKSILEETDKEVTKTVKAVAKWILADLRYLYKDEAFEWEEEYRIIRVAEFGGEKIKEDDDRTPPRFYLETPPFLFAESGGKVTVGPRVAEKAAAEIYIRQRLTKNGWNKTTDIAHSKMPYR